MKLIPKTRVTNDDPLGHGMEVALTIVVFLALGWLIDRWLGTSPWFIIGFVVFAAVGSFVKLRYTYEARMREHEAERARLQQERRAATGFGGVASGGVEQ